MVAPTPEQVLKNLTEVQEVRITLFTDFDHTSFLLTNYCKLPESDKLQNSSLVRFLSDIETSFGTMRDSDGVVLGHVTAAVMPKDKGYILYLKFNNETKMVDIYSVGEDFLSFITQQHNWFIKNPSPLAMSWIDVADKVKFIYDLDVEHQFSPSVRRSETALETRLTAFDTTVDFGSVNYSDGFIDFYPTGDYIEVTELAPEHTFSPSWFNDNINTKYSKYKLAVSNNAILMTGHGGIGLVYCYDNKKTYIANKFITKNVMSIN